MRICVVGLWHLGCVTAACLAHAGHNVTALDFDSELIGQLRKGQPPLFEPGLEALIGEGLETGHLRFETDVARCVADADVVWVTFDTPIDENDAPQVAAVIEPVTALLQSFPDRWLVLIFAQLPVGSTRLLAERAAKAGRTSVTFGYSPENLRLGKA